MSRGLVWAGATLILAIGGCTAPLVKDDGPTGPPVLGEMATAQPFEIQTDDGAWLRGVFCPAGPEAPIVLHLLPSSVSTTSGIPTGVGRASLAPTLQAFADAGWSSLVLDYRGVGDSSGCRESARLREDGKAMWAAAVELAGGDEHRVLLRAASVGSLVAVDLLRGGAQPGGLIFVAPIRAESVVAHAARRRLGGFLGSVVAMFYKRPIGADMPEVLRTIEHIPVLVILPAEDEHVSASELSEVEDAARTAGHEVLRTDEDHHRVVLRAWGFVVEPNGFSGRATAELRAEEAAFVEGVRHTLTSR